VRRRDTSRRTEKRKELVEEKTKRERRKEERTEERENCASRSAASYPADRSIRSVAHLGSDKHTHLLL
jgi:hypothetical protein